MSTTVRIALAWCALALVGGCSPPMFRTEADRARYRYQRNLEQVGELVDQGDYGGAYEAIQSVAPRGEDRSLAAPYWYRVGLLHVEIGAGGHDIAWNCFRKAIQADPSLVGPRTELARLALNRRSYDYALRQLDEELRLSPTRQEALLLRRDIEAKQAERDAKKREIEEARVRRARERKERREAAEAVRAEERARLSVQVASIGTLSCRPVDFERIGDELESPLGTTTAKGTFVGGLLNCSNNGSDTSLFPDDAVRLVGGNGARYALDTDGELGLLLWQDDESRIQLPFGLQLHPGLTTGVALVFDVPELVASDPALRLLFGQALFRLSFAEDADR